MGQLWARHFSTVEICLHFSERVSTVTSFKDRLEYPDEGLWLPQQHWRQTQPRKWMCQITQCHPLGESCRCLCVCVCACVLACVRAGIENFISPALSMLLPIFRLTLISLFLHLTHLMQGFFCLFVFFFILPHTKMQSEQLYLRCTETWLAHFLFLLLCKCHNLDCSLISYHLRSNYLDLLCFSAD